MERLLYIQKPDINGKKSLFAHNIILFLFVLLSILEPKQIKLLFNLNIIWFYPQYFILGIAVLMLVTFRNNIVLNKSNIKILLISYLFSFCYLISSFINNDIMNLSYDVLFSLQGLLKVLIQYCLYILLLTILIDNYPNVIFFIMKYIFILSFINIIFILIGVICYKTGTNFLPIQSSINNEIMNQSWIKVLSFSSFLPKFGGLFTETQELGLYLLISYICYLLLRKYGIKFNRILLIYGQLLPVLIILTFSKSVIPALAFFLMWSYKGKKYLKYKALFTLLFAVCFLFIVVTTYSNSIRYYYIYAFKADSIGERIFHIITFFSYVKEHIFSFFVGMGPYNYGNYLQSISHGLFNKYSNAISIFTIFIESGFLGFITYLLLWGYMIVKSKNYLIKCSLISMLIGNIGQPNWSMDILVMACILIYNLDNYGGLLNENHN